LKSQDECEDFGWGFITKVIGLGFVSISDDESLTSEVPGGTLSKTVELLRGDK
jgi:hypothetical protein